MAASAKTFVRYFIPQDGDSEAHPNVFPVAKASDAVCLRDIRAAFPLPGEYLFRFKAQFGKSHVWLDVTDDDEAAPRFDKAIVAKVARLSFGGAPTAAARASAPSATASARPAHRGAAASSTSSTAAAPSPKAAPPKPSPAPAAPAPAPAGEAQDDVDFLGSGLSDSSSPAAAAAAEDGDDLGGLFDGPHAATPAPAAAQPAMMAPKGRAPVHSSFTAGGGRGTPGGGRGTPTAGGRADAASRGSGDFSDLVDM